MNRFRIWGSSDLRRWLPMDVWRPIKSTLVTLDVPGTRPSPAFTPLRAKEFLRGARRAAERLTSDHHAELARHDYPETVCRSSEYASLSVS